MGLFAGAQPRTLDDVSGRYRPQAVAASTEFCHESEVDRRCVDDLRDSSPSYDPQNLTTTSR